MELESGLSKAEDAFEAELDQAKVEDIISLLLEFAFLVVNFRKISFRWVLLSLAYLDNGMHSVRIDHMCNNCYCPFYKFLSGSCHILSKLGSLGDLDSVFVVPEVEVWIDSEFGGLDSSKVSCFVGCWESWGGSTSVSGSSLSSLEASNTWVGY